MKRAATFMLCSFLFASSLMAQDTSFSLAPLELVPTSILADEVPIAQQEEIQSIISSDIVREQLTNGRVERQVALDPQGNFVNHGSYTQFDRSGKVLLTGQYRMGVRIGVWTKNVTDRNAPVLKVYPFSNGKLPIKSTVEFVDGKMHGSWSIEDADNRVLSQIDFSHGVRLANRFGCTQVAGCIAIASTRMGISMDRLSSLISRAKPFAKLRS